MDAELTRAEQMLAWELFAAGGTKLLKDVAPGCKRAAASLADRRLLTSTPHGRTRLLALEDRGWRWIADCDPFPMRPDEKGSLERRLLRDLIGAAKRFAGRTGHTIQEVFRVEPVLPPTPERKARGKPASRRTRATERDATGAGKARKRRDIAGEVRAAFFALAGRPPREGVRLSALRDRLADVPRADLDRTLLAMRKAGAANLMNLDNPRDLEEERDAELRSGRHVFHIVWIET